MKLIHLSDLHIGRRLKEMSLIEDQKYILAQILDIIAQEKPQGVIIAGDVYDKSVPSAEAVTLLDQFLWDIARLEVPVLLISGNHDSPERLAFGSRLLDKNGIHLSPVYDGQVTPVILQDELGPVKLWMLPFLKPSQVRRFYPDETIESYTDACRVAVEQMHIDPTERNILITHQFVTGAATCDSEEVSVGGSDNVDAEVFRDFDYVALGHIHGPQNVGGSNRIRYCGTPLKYSFSEAGHHKSVTVVHLGQKGELSLEMLPLIPRHDLRSIRGSFHQLTDRSLYQNTVTDDYLHVILTDEEDVPEALARLQTVYPNILHLTYDNTRTRTNRVVDGAERAEEKKPLALFAELYEYMNNQPMSQEQEAFVKSLIEGIWEGEQ